LFPAQSSSSTPPPPSPYSSNSTGSSGDSLASIFANALAEIKSYSGTTSSTNS
jgi:hypothetical protein